MDTPKLKKTVIGKDPKRRQITEENTEEITEELVFKMDTPSVELEMGETLEILIDSTDSFTVFIPYPGIFAEQIFHAEDASSWTTENAEKKWWGVRMTRIIGYDMFPIREIPYCVYNKELNNFAVGNSPPTMVVKP